MTSCHDSMGCPALRAWLQPYDCYRATGSGSLGCSAPLPGRSSFTKPTLASAYAGKAPLPIPSCSIAAALVPLSKQPPGQSARDIEVEWSVSGSVGFVSDTIGCGAATSGSLQGGMSEGGPVGWGPCHCRTLEPGPAVVRAKTHCTYKRHIPPCRGMHSRWACIIQGMLTGLPLSW